MPHIDIHNQAIFACKNCEICENYFLYNTDAVEVLLYWIQNIILTQQL